MSIANPNPAPDIAEIEPQLPERLGSSHSKQALRMWLRLLTSSVEIEKLLRNNFVREFNTTLPRFDILSALDRSPAGLTMGDLSRLLMVSNGNVTGLVDRLAQEGLVAREAMASDRRTYRVTTTDAGKRSFAAMARRHEEWLDDMLDDLSGEDIEQLLTLLNRVRVSVSKRKLNRD